MARPVIALLTDFGLQDHYVAAMKGVILGICPDAALLDVTHHVPPQDILAGALELDALVSYLPAGTIVVGVIDPGVGSARRGIAVEAGPYRFVGPDNGLFDLALRQWPAVRSVELANPAFARATVSRTFEGRDRFAPAAAWLASGVDLAELGPPVTGLVTLTIPEPVVSALGIDGAVLRVDHFGNLVTNITRSLLSALGSNVEIHVAGATVDGVARTYADAAHGALCALVGSTDRLEISIAGGSAAAVLGTARHASVQVRRRSAA